MANHAHPWWYDTFPLNQPWPHTMYHPLHLTSKVTWIWLHVVLIYKQRCVLCPGTGGGHTTGGRSTCCISGTRLQRVNINSTSPWAHTTLWPTPTSKTKSQQPPADLWLSNVHSCMRCMRKLGVCDVLLCGSIVLENLKSHWNNSILITLITNYTMLFWYGLVDLHVHHYNGQTNSFHPG